MQMWQQLLGGNVMLYYLVYIFNMAGEVSNFLQASTWCCTVAAKESGL